MTFAAKEISTADGRPVELYLFATNNGVQWYFTNAENDLIFNGSTYVGIAIARSQFSQSTERRATKITVVMAYLEALTAAFAQLSISQPIEGLTTLTIYRHHQSDTGNEFIQNWKGTISSSAFNEDGEVEFLCTGMKNVFEREGPRMNYGASCQHSLYDALCTLSEVAHTDFTVTVTAISSDGITITLNPADIGTSPIRNFIGGKMIKDNGNDKRLIVKQASNVLTLQYPFRSDFVTGDFVNITQGCNHQLTGDCKNKFANELNYGGAAYTPGLNPFIAGLDLL
jgi:hypothetical protein